MAEGAKAWIDRARLRCVRASLTLLTRLLLQWGRFRDEVYWERQGLQGYGDYWDWIMGTGWKYYQYSQQDKITSGYFYLCGMLINIYGWRSIIMAMAQQQVKQKKQLSVLVKSGLMGALRSMMSLPLQHPFDALKTNMQAHQTDIRTEFCSILQRKGWRGFYNGFSMNLTRVMVKAAYRWPLWISVQTFYKNKLPNTNEIVRQSVTGFSITLCELLIVSPFQRVKVWLMTTRNQEEAKIKNYYTKKLTIGDLYTGLVPTIIRQGLSWSSFLASTEIMKTEIRKYKGTEHLTALDLFLGSIPVSIVNTLFIMPVDCIKTYTQQYEQAQKQPFHKNVSKMFKTYGLRGLYLGWSARMIQYMIQSTFTLIVIEDLINQYQGRSKV